MLELLPFSMLLLSCVSNPFLLASTFSDIVGFTNISSTMEARKVANLLDRLYSKFDELSNKHDVFKVETIVSHPRSSDLICNEIFLLFNNLSLTNIIFDFFFA